MWLAIDVATGRTLDQPFPTALRTAVEHRIGDDYAFTTVGDVVTEVFPVDGRVAPARRIIATYTCIDVRVHRATFRATYTDGTGRVQWIRIYWCRRLRAWRANNDEFTVYPD